MISPLDSQQKCPFSNGKEKTIELKFHLDDDSRFYDSLNYNPLRVYSVPSNKLELLIYFYLCKKMTCNADRCTASLVDEPNKKIKKTKQDILEEAIDFFKQFYNPENK